MIFSRREFITKTCMACAGGSVLSSILSACSATHYVNGVFNANSISVSRKEFDYVKKDKISTRQFILVHHDKLEYPIYLFRISDNEYSALWMKCSHQGSELQASGDHLYCPSHGSEFDKNGNVTQGPAEKNLRSFPVTMEGETLLINLS